VIEVLPSALVEVISMMPGTPVSCVSSGVATADAMVSALAPGRLALTRMVGNSASGRGATGNRGNAATPSSITASVSSVVATGCRTNQLDSETRCSWCGPGPGNRCAGFSDDHTRAQARLAIAHDHITHPQLALYGHLPVLGFTDGDR
jgi:hypothetical protein